MKKDLISIQSLSGNLVVSSKEIAEHFEKRHNDVVEAIENKIGNLTTENIVVEKYFVESEFNHRGNVYKEYLLTRDGFSFIVMGFTGAKADIWKLKYIEAFNKMEQELKAPMQGLSPQLQLLINMELKQREFEIAITETKSEIQGMRDVIKLDTNSWRTDSKDLIVKISHRLGGNELIREIRNESYELLNTRMGVSLETRLTNKRRRMADEGVSKSKRDKLNLLDVIADDKKLIEGYIAIVKEMSIKYGA